jgi:signal transduction histidine kinase
MTEMNVPPEKRKMLIIDDEKKLLLGLKAVMTRAGFDVFIAPEGNEGIRLAKEQLPDIIICDVMMPAPNGFQVKKILSGDHQTASIPFIFLTARTGEIDKIAGLNQGADDFITKPFNIDELIARVQAILRRNEIGRRTGIQEMEGTMEKLRHSIAANLGHELRTPLGIILASLDLAVQEKFHGRMKDLDWYLNTSLNNAHKLSMLITDLILLYDIDQGKVNRLRRTINLQFHFTDPIQKVISRYAEKKLDTQTLVESDVTINAPELEFTHAVCHLVENACKFAPPGAKIWIKLVKNGEGGCILTVENEGSMVPIELREKVFERYYQINQGDARPYGGLGVGLTIARAVAEAGGGSVMFLDSAIGCKVCFVYPPAQADWGISIHP